MIVTPEKLAVLKRELVGRKIQLKEDVDAAAFILEKGDTGTVVEVVEFGYLIVNWLSGKKARLYLSDPWELVSCCSKEQPHKNVEGLDPNEKHWIKGVRGGNPMQWGYGEAETSTREDQPE